MSNSDEHRGAPASGQANAHDQGSGATSIRHAATVVVARPTHGGQPEIYMLRRSARSTFMPSTLVFPGGRLEREDGPPQQDEAWERCARRECLEESALRIEGPLRWFDTWLTPSAESRRRYLARFYLATLPAGAGDEACADEQETHDGRWATPSDHLLAWRTGDVDLPPPTLSTLLRLRALSFEGLRDLVNVDPQGVILPKVTLQDGRPTIIMPHDPDYDDLPGEGAAPPTRAQSLPRRFIRGERGWNPWPDSND